MYLILGLISGAAFGQFAIRQRKRMKLAFGNREAWRWFNEQFSCFVQVHSRLEAMRDKVFVRPVNPNHWVDYLIFGLGRVCAEDFEQILNLCGNGFGIGALQMLRSMYERQVTAAYLSNHPDEADAFVEYDYIHTRKLVSQFKQVYKNEPEILNGIVSEEEQAEIENNYTKFRPKFQKTKCETCQTTEDMFSWTKLDLPSMALKSEQPALKDMYPYSYFMPLLMGHSTFKSVEARVVFREDGSFSFESEGQQKAIKRALVLGHHLFLHVLDLQNKRFKLGLDKALTKCEKDYLECWNSKDE
jgi:hypothetical protein